MITLFCNDTYVKCSDQFDLPIDFGDGHAQKIATLIEDTLLKAGYPNLKIQWTNILSQDNPDQCSGRFLIVDTTKHPEFVAE